MKFSIQQKQLALALKMVSGVVAKRTTLPILSSILLRVEGGRLHLAGTDLDTTIQYARDLDIKQYEEGECCVRLSLLAGIVGDVPELRDIEIKLGAKERLAVRSGAGVYHLCTLPADEFPPLPKMRGALTRIGLDQFKTLFASVRAAQATDGDRYILNGCKWEIKEDSMRAIATDGRRCNVMRLPLGADEEVRNAIIPAAAVDELLRVLPDSGDGVLRVVIGDNAAEFEWRTDFSLLKLTTKLIEGNYPNVDQVIPPTGRTVIAQREDLLAALGRLRRVGEHALLEFSKNCLRLSTKAEKSEDDGLESIPLASSEELLVRLNIDYLTDALNSIHEDAVKLQFTTANEPFVVRSTQRDFLALVMPLRLEPGPGGPGGPSGDSSKPATEEMSAPTPSVPEVPSVTSEPVQTSAEPGADAEPDAEIAAMQKENAEKAWGKLDSKVELEKAKARQEKRDSSSAPAQDSPDGQPVPTGDFTALVDDVQAMIEKYALEYIGVDELRKPSFRLGFSGACKVMDALEARGAVGPILVKGKNKGKRIVVKKAQ